METFLFYAALFVLAIWVLFAIESFIGSRSIKFLKDIEPAVSRPPRVSVIIPACNEEKNIEEALLSVLSQDYEDLEFIVINDRSIDRTGEILNRCREADRRLRVIHIESLPPGWLGKNHALFVGASKATGQILLFTDADIVMKPSAISRAVGHMLARRLDHVTVAAEVRMPGVLLGIFTGAFGIFFSLYSRPWKASDSKSSKHIGIGGFNMVRAEVYRAAGTHRAIKMRPDDDMKLGKLIKKTGHRQEMLYGKDMMYVEWYSSVGELIDGLMKNSFAGIDYSIAAVIGSTFGLFFMNVWPFISVFVTDGAARWVSAATVVLIFLLYWGSARLQGLRRWYGVGHAPATLLFIFIIWRSMILALKNNGISWRGTHYPLSELKANKV